MLKIRLTRRGKKHQPSYRIILTEARWKRNGKYLKSLGFYNPSVNPPIIKINKKAYLEWLAKGAQPSERVKKIIKRIE